MSDDEHARAWKKAVEANKPRERQGPSRNLPAACWSITAVRKSSGAVTSD